MHLRSLMESPMAVIMKHSTQARGARQFAERLQRSVVEIKDLRLLNVRRSRIKPRRRPPSVHVQSTVVLIHYYNEGSMQRLSATPSSGVAVPDLAKKIQLWLADQ